MKYRLSLLSGWNHFILQRVAGHSNNMIEIYPHIYGVRHDYGAFIVLIHKDIFYFALRCMHLIYFSVFQFFENHTGKWKMTKIGKVCII